MLSSAIKSSAVVLNTDMCTERHCLFCKSCTMVVQKVSSDELLRKKQEYITNQFILPFDVHTVHYFST